MSSGGSTTDSTIGVQTDFAWGFTPGEDKLQTRQGDFRSGLGASYYDNYNNSGLSGTLIWNGFDINPVKFLVGLNTNVGQLLATNSLVVG